MTKLLVLYVFHIYNNRVTHFINNCIFYDSNVDFIIISNDKNNTLDVPFYVKTLFRDNIGYDFGGWSDALLTNNLYKNYVFEEIYMYNPNELKYISKFYGILTVYTMILYNIMYINSLKFYFNLLLVQFNQPINQSINKLNYKLN